MPVKQHIDAPPLSKAWVYALMVGTPAPCRLPGWVAFEQDAVKTADGMYSWTTAGDRLWAEHGERLTEEARDHGFVPYWHGKRKPHADGFTRWQANFLRRHSY